MPDEAYVRLHTVADLYAVAPSSIWRWSKAGRIPAPRKLGPQVTAWNVGELRRALSTAEAA
ncbi:MAG: AlpA family phage regulatory protein [Caulobacteraceae bacterium]|nr:AlpA family phage regulatory protein [Caulobacteraceae bacterium]